MDTIGMVGDDSNIRLHDQHTWCESYRSGRQSRWVNIHKGRGRKGSGTYRLIGANDVNRKRSMGIGARDILEGRNSDAR